MLLVVVASNNPSSDVVLGKSDVTVIWLSACSVVDINGVVEENIIGLGS